MCQNNTEAILRYVKYGIAMFIARSISTYENVSLSAV